MYIAIEGVKGVGKTTLVKSLQDYLEKQKIRFALASPTRAGSLNLVNEVRFTSEIADLSKDSLKEFTYAYYSNIAAASVDWNLPLVIGDRSIVTSYATRLWKYKNPLKHIERVNLLEPLIPVPDVIIYLHTDLKTILKRLHKRKDRHYGKEDECPLKVLEDARAYNFIMNEKPASRLCNTKWFVVDATKEANIVFDSTIVILKKLLNIF